MNQRLFNILEIIVIAGLILAVMYFGGVFKIGPVPTPTPTRPLSPTQPPRTTAAPSPAAPTATQPPLTQPQGLITFESTRDGNSEIYIMSVEEALQGTDGNGQRNLTNNPAEDYAPAWSPDGKRISFFSTRTGWLEIYVMNADGSGVIQLSDTHATNTAYVFPLSWSPDGQQIVAARIKPWFVGRYTSSATLDLIQADGSGAVPLYQSDSFSLSNPSWSPDGEYLAVLVSSPSVYGTYISTVGVSHFDLDTPIQPCYSFAWLPDGTQLVCRGSNTIFTIRPDGSDRKQLVGELFDGWVNVLAWSPDGEHLLFKQTRYNPTVAQGDEMIAVTTPGGSGYAELLSGQGIAQDSNLSWAPDSQWFAYHAKQEGHTDIYIVNMYDPEHPVRLTHDSGDNFSPQWQP